MKAPVLFMLLCLASALAAPRPCYAAPGEPGLLPHLSGGREFTADFAAGGDPRPNFIRDVRVIGDGAKGPGFECADTRLMSYSAPGNVYAERGTPGAGSPTRCPAAARWSSTRPRTPRTTRAAPSGGS